MTEQYAISARYVGTIQELRNERALILTLNRTPVYHPQFMLNFLVQFDNMELAESHGWHRFPATDFDEFHWSDH